MALLPAAAAGTYAAGPTCRPTIDGPYAAGPVSRFWRFAGTGVGAVTFTVDSISVAYFVTAPTEITLSDADDACVDGGLSRLDHRIGPTERVLVARAPGVAEHVRPVGDRVLDRLDDLDDPAVAVLEPVRALAGIEDPVVHQVRRRSDAADRDRAEPCRRVRVTGNGAAGVSPVRAPARTLNGRVVARGGRSERRWPEVRARNDDLVVREARVALRIAGRRRVTSVVEARIAGVVAVRVL